MKKQMKTMVKGLIMLGLLFLCVIVSLFVLAAIPSEPTEVSATPIPTTTSTPTPVLSVKDQIKYAVQGQPLYGDLKSIVYSDGKATVTYYIPADEIPDHETARNQIKINSFYVEKSIWQNVKQVNKVQVVVEGDLVDKYGKSSIGDLGRVDLTEATEEKFNWDGLEYSSAWDVYDAAWLLPDLLT